MDEDGKYWVFAQSERGTSASYELSQSVIEMQAKTINF